MVNKFWFKKVLNVVLVLSVALAGSQIILPTAEAVTARTVTSPYLYNFNSAGVLDEAGRSEDSSSPYWWLSSGGRLIIENGLGYTIQGDLPTYDKWRLLYAANNPRDTDNGYHPQNLFRLVTRSRWENFVQTVSFRIIKLNMSASPERDAWSGILLFNRYADQYNLYYIGLRHDGTGIIKKKLYGKYYTLAQKTVFTSDSPYNRDTNPNLIPGNQWIGLRSVVRTNADSSVTLQLWVDRQNKGNWQLVMQTTDTGRSSTGVALLGDGYAGVRSDFMDVQFENYQIQRT